MTIGSMPIFTSCRNSSEPDRRCSAIEIMGCCSAISDGLLGKLRNILPDTRITTIGQIVSTQIETNRLMAKVSVILLVLIAVIGSISIANYMWANVEERRREIGTFLTLGATRGSIYRLFFAKAVILGLLGGICGYLLGSVIGHGARATARGALRATGSDLSPLVTRDRRRHCAPGELVPDVPGHPSRSGVDSAGGVAVYLLENADKAYTSRRGTVHALRDVSLEIPTGSCVTITGPSGSGKTTLLLTLGGLIRPTSGRVFFHGVDLGGLSDAKLARYRNQKVGFVLQTFNLVPYLSALENVMVPMMFMNGSNNGAAGRARDLLGPPGLGRSCGSPPPGTLGRTAAARGDRPGSGKRSGSDPGR